ncbi:MAG TPA: oxygen-independent coproporphyrinogen III oxidase, partial [Agitococcus sp.]|nr:oxygen-independent coproporphyrinogen III oxidase [Agitococcus sp.]
MTMMPTAIEFDLELIQRYDLSGPRYTSYPTAVQFHNHFSEQAYLQAIADSNQSRRPLSLYFHLPFCAHVCYYCACNKIITANRKRAAPYLDHLHQEIAL